MTAIAAQRAGAGVTVLERAADPRSGAAGYTDRSFNVTLNSVGRRELGEERAWDGGVVVFGREVHTFGNPQSVNADYSETDVEARTNSIPRPILRQNLATIAEAEGVRLLFDSRVTEVDPNAAVVGFHHGGRPHRERGDLIVLADGIHSVGDDLIRKYHSESVKVVDESRSYVTAMLDPALHDLSSNYLHIWHTPGREAFAVGVPNVDGSVAVLLISNFADIAKDDHPFATRSAALQRLRRDFPEMLEIDSGLPERLPNLTRGYFYYKSSPRFTIGERCAIVGDAGCASPPWVGWGVNVALHSATSVVAHAGDLETGLPRYDAKQRALSLQLQAYVREHGDFLAGRVATHASERAGRGPLEGMIRSVAAG
jgi:2-polyprenyl-6-methoxyphenol hydroxylase-like FAD-dependent oxidoreductase